ncbi:uncharacterized protein N7483_010713 [Penicillium malachiteum]|uniref:uncharacterized protein n=1 Tax=Penicillium malachiteum TaxID=1324776 RepID=UPI0025477589|nr:uncharacterized protein N7483_010713 [Penicillium malachiteum]KAJ5713532.1 hypothetical protein N7483_010713 [Penicillium malachiteum]
MKRLGERAGEVVDMTKWSLFYTFDVMGLVTFSKDYKQLDDAEEHFTIAAMHSQMEIVGIFGAIPWIVPILTSIPGLKGPLEVFVRYSNAQIDERKAEWNQDPDPEKMPKDVTSWLIKAMQEGDPSAPSTIEAFHDDGRLAIIAGSDTTGSTLTNILYFLAKHPEAYKRLQKELDDIKSSGGDVSQIPYLDAIISEALRLRPVLPSGLKRNTPPEGLLVDEVWIPGNTIVFAAQHVIQRDERNFENALEFIPERWLDEGKYLHKNDQAWFPFSIGMLSMFQPSWLYTVTLMHIQGHYSCVGRPLALMQIRTVLHRIASEFDLSFPPGEDGRHFWEETKDTFTLMCPALPVVLTKREGATSQS